MIVSHKHKFIFVKTSKTAGSSIESYLVNNYLGPNDVCTGSMIDGTPQLNTNIKNGHISWDVISSNYPQEWNNYFKFAVERNPWDKMVSLFYFYKKWKPNVVEQGFDHFVKHHSHRSNDWNLYSHNDIITVDTVINFSNLHEDIKKLPIPYNNELLEVFMKSDTRKNKDYRQMYTEETKRSIEQVSIKPIQYFGFTF